MNRFYDDARIIQEWRPLPEWEESEVDIQSAIEAIKFLLDAPTVPQKDNMARRALLFLGVEVGDKNACA